MVSVYSEILPAAKALWDFHCVYDELHQADAIIGLGSYDLRVAERCAELYRAGFASRVVFTGASGNWTQGLYNVSEAAAFARHAVEHGLPSDAITLEETATNIGENIVLASAIVPDARSVIIVTKPQTQLRCRATTDKKWPEPYSMITAPLTHFEQQPTALHNERGLFCEMVGDLERLMTYPALGFQNKVDVPDAVLCAFAALKAAGFTDHLPGKS
ncbi:MAG: YdcF family protein [Hoeflea sp.]|uniref:YdcF family protein n=1 Tax=Hoeflea sp. TaxID=1940281 RepID=UPI003EF2C098